MKQLLISLLCLALTSGVFAAGQPIGSLGNGFLQQAQFLPDGTILRVMANRIEIVDPNTSAVIEQFAEGLNWSEVTLSPDGTWLAVVTNPHRAGIHFIEIWEMVTRKQIRRWDARLDQINMVAFSPEAPLLAGVSRDQIHLWNWDTVEPLGRLEGVRRPARNCHVRDNGNSRTCSSPPSIRSLAFSPDGRFLVVGSQRPDAEIWDVSTRKLVGHLEGHADWVSVVSYSPDGRFIATAEPESLRVYLWDAQRRQLIRDWLNGDEGEVQQLHFSSNSQRLYVATRTDNIAVDKSRRNDRIRVWDVETGAQLNQFGDELLSLYDFSLSPDEKIALFQYLFVGAVLWDVEHDRRLAFWADYPVGEGALSPDGRSFVMVRSTVMKIWDVPSRSLRKVIFPENQPFRKFAISPDSQTIAVGQDPWIELRDIHTGEVTAQLRYHHGHTGIAFSQTGRRVAAERRIFDVDAPESPQELEKLGRISIAFSDGDAYLASTAGDDRIHLWEQQDGKYVSRYTWHSPMGSGWRSTLAFLPPPYDVPVLAAGGFRQVPVWRIGDELERLLILDAKGPVHFSGDGKYLFVNGEDGLQIWDWRERKQIEHEPIPEYFAVNRDGSVLLTWDDESGRILIWDGKALLPPDASAPWDVNRDGAVNVLDLVHVASQFGQVGKNLSGDVNGDEVVNVSDLVLVGSHFGESSGAAAPFIANNHQLSIINRQSQALAELKDIEDPSRGERIARDFLRTWLANAEPTITETKLLPNYPNPFNPETWIPYQLAKASYVTVTIYNAQGQQIRRLALGSQPAGSYLTQEKAAYWDGRNEAGERMASGVYFYTLQVALLSYFSRDNFNRIEN